MHLYLFARVGTSYSRKHADENIALENRENRFIGAFSASVPFTNTMYAGLEFKIAATAVLQDINSMYITQENPLFLHFI